MRTLKFLNLLHMIGILREDILQYTLIKTLKTLQFSYCVHESLY